MQTLTLERRPPLRLARLDTGPRNVLREAAVRELTRALATDAEAPVLVLSGREDGFCAGLDGAVLAGGAREREGLLAAMGDLLLTALESPTRIVAECRGHAVAAGAMLLLVADVRLGVPGSYKVGFTEPGLGMPLPELPALLARERLDRRRLHELTVLGRTVGPDGAVEAGFLDALVQPDALTETAHDRARELAGLSEAAYGGTVRAVRGPVIARIRALVAQQNARRDAARADRD